MSSTLKKICLGVEKILEEVLIDFATCFCRNGFECKILEISFNYQHTKAFIYPETRAISQQIILTIIEVLF